MLKKISGYFIILIIFLLQSNLNCFLQMPKIDIKKIEIKNINIEKTKTTARISWITTEESNCRTSIEATTFHTKGKQHSVFVSGLNPGNHYIFYIEAENNESDVYMESDYHEGSFITDNAESISITDITIVDSSSTHITLKWKTDTIANCYIEYGENSFYGNTKNSTSSDLLVHEVTLTDLIGNTTYHYKIHAENIGVGWLSSETTERTFFIYGDPVVISNETSTVNLADVTITCITDLESNCTLEYSTDSTFSNYNYQDMNTTDHLSHNVTIEDLTSGVYYYRIRAIPINSIYSNGLSDNLFFLIDVTDSIIVELEDASNIENGTGTFGDPANVLCKEYSVPLIEGFDFEYDSPLNSEPFNIWDNGIAGSFSTDKFIRIVENGKNITDITGLNLTPIAKNLSIYTFSPLSNQCYIDPIRGKFMLPRPAYWSRMESIDNIASAEVYNNNFNPIYSIHNYLYVTPIAGKFSNCIRAYAYNPPNSYARSALKIYPFGESFNIPQSGTISFWLKMNNVEVDISANPHIYIFGEYLSPICVDLYLIYFDSTYGWSQYNTYRIYYENDRKTPDDLAGLQHDIWNHVYIVWGNLKDGKTLRLWVNGKNIWDVTDPIPDLSGSQFYFVLQDRGGGYDIWKSYIYYDNLKIWTHVVSEDPAWIYNNGNGMENALHFIYSEENGYRPKLIANGSGVGYFHTQ